MDAQAASDWLRTGGVGAFAGVVLYLLFQLRPIFKALLKTLVETKEVLAALLERERARAERIAANEAARAAAAGESWDDDETKPIAVKTRARTNPGGIPISQYSVKRPGGG